jgi:hypothetical protein
MKRGNQIRKMLYSRLDTLGLTTQTKPAGTYRPAGFCFTTKSLRTESRREISLTLAICD